ncbi:MAG: hypothetical protein A3J70_07385 [Elusimicrobia bacterium RIFCSPHIGHO2_02_FULL_61_10]|nr:MAG: hypothetical protein A3J70_07385 [Elusimicrobia bacterium RIFCSPHIGHO2_02_FULL_61_10]
MIYLASFIVYNTRVPVYEFICKTPQGREVRGECKAKSVNELNSILGKTGLTLITSQEKILIGHHAIVTPEFAKEIAGVLKMLREPPKFAQKSNFLQSLLLFLILTAASVLLYAFIDSRLDALEELSFVQAIQRRANPPQPQ